MALKTIGLTAAAVGVAGAVALGGHSIADAATSTTSGSTSGSSSTTARPDRGSADTPVTGAELARVKAAATAKYPTLTVTEVRKDPDGSYDVLGTKAGAKVFLDVSADLKTFTERTGGPGGPGGHGGPGGGGGSDDTPVTGSELTKVTAAVKAKDSAVSVTSVRKDPDGSYDVLGTKSGSTVFLEVSADLKTITQNTAGVGGRGGRGPGAPSSSSSASSSSDA